MRRTRTRASSSTTSMRLMTSTSTATLRSTTRTASLRNTTEDDDDAPPRDGAIRPPPANKVTSTWPQTRDEGLKRGGAGWRRAGPTTVGTARKTLGRRAACVRVRWHVLPQRCGVLSLRLGAC
eukprot:1320323-Prymnesium_polylepis.1